MIHAITATFFWKALADLSLCWTLMLIDIKMKKKSVLELGHNGGLKIYDNLKKIYVNPYI